MEENKNITKPKKKKKWIIILAVIVLIVGGIGVASAMSGAKGIPVTVSEVTKQDVAQDVEINGVVASENVETMFAKVDGTVADVLVKDGAYVTKGSKLLTYDEEAIEDSIKKVELESKATTYGADATMITIGSAQAKAAQAAGDYATAQAYVKHYSDCVSALQAQMVEATATNEKLQKKQAEIAELKEKLAAKPESEKLADKLKEAEKEAKELSKLYDSYDVTHLQANLETLQSDLAEYKSQEAEYKAVAESADPAAGKERAQQEVIKESAKLSVEDAKKMLEKAKEGVSTQCNAIVSDVQVAKGQTVTAGTPLFTLSDADKVEAKIEITKQNLSIVAVGQKATVTINGKEYEGSVSNIRKAAKTNAAGATVVEASVHIDNPDDAIYLGVEASVKIHIAEKKDVVVVPYDCINYATDSTFCYVVKDGIVEKREIEVGVAATECVEIVKGLSEGEQVVCDSQIELTEGMKVNATVAQGE